ncbi:Ig-like domain-containing protein [Holdemania massiliensis]
MSTSSAVKPNTTYQLVFDHKAQQLNSADFTLEMTQKTHSGESISTHQVTLNDNLCMSEDWAAYSLNFVTAYSADTLDLSFRLSGGEGTLWLDDVQIREAVPTENIFLKTEASALKVGDKTTVTVERLPKAASDVALHWFSSDEQVAVVDEQGQVTAMKPGKAYIGLGSDSELRAEASLLVKVEK